MVTSVESLKLLALAIFFSFGIVYDVFNKKEIPDVAIYYFLAVSLLMSWAFNGEAFLAALLQAGVVASFGYILYKMGVMGLADPLYFSIVALLFPFLPNAPVAIPFILVAVVYSGVLFGMFSTFYYAYKLYREGPGKPNLKGLLILPAYLFFLYVYLESPLASPYMVALVSLVTAPAVFVSIYSERIKELIETEVDVEDAEEEVVSDNAREELAHIIGNEKVVTKKHIEKMKRNGIKKIKVYGGMLPFIPFLALGVLAAYAYGFPLILP